MLREGANEFVDTVGTDFISTNLTKQISRVSMPIHASGRGSDKQPAEEFRYWFFN
jgi:hypothetical protein